MPGSHSRVLACAEGGPGPCRRRPAHVSEQRPRFSPAGAAPCARALHPDRTAPPGVLLDLHFRPRLDECDRATAVVRRTPCFAEGAGSPDVGRGMPLLKGGAGAGGRMGGPRCSGLICSFSLSSLLRLPLLFYSFRSLPTPRASLPPTTPRRRRQSCAPLSAFPSSPSSRRLSRTLRPSPLTIPPLWRPSRQPTKPVRDVRSPLRLDPSSQADLSLSLSLPCSPSFSRCPRA